MAGRPSVNKRQRELLRKERQAEKLTRRDERRTKKNVGDVEPGNLGDVEPALAPAPPEPEQTAPPLEPIDGK